MYSLVKYSTLKRNANGNATTTHIKERLKSNNKIAFSIMRKIRVFRY